MTTLKERLALDGYEGADPVLFYAPQNKFGEFSNFSAHAVSLVNPWTNQLQRYLTGEHRYQAMKAVTESEHDFVAASATPLESKRRGRTILLREDWGSDVNSTCYVVMKQLVLAKALQHSQVKDSLLRTGDRPIYEDSPVDDIWGVRYRNDYRGKNLLGLAWMQARKELNAN